MKRLIGLIQIHEALTPNVQELEVSNGDPNSDNAVTVSMCSLK